MCILYTVWHKLCGNVCSQIVPVALYGRGFTVCFTFPFMWVCFQGRLGGLCIFSFCTRQYQKNVDNSHVIFSSDHWLNCSPLHYQYKKCHFVLSQLKLNLLFTFIFTLFFSCFKSHVKLEYSTHCQITQSQRFQVASVVKWLIKILTRKSKEQGGETNSGGFYFSILHIHDWQL